MEEACILGGIVVAFILMMASIIFIFVKMVKDAPIIEDEEMKL